jgi:hypothetical protein
LRGSVLTSLSVVAALGLPLVGCQAIADLLPSKPTVVTTTTTTQPAIVLPVVIPAPSLVPNPPPTLAPPTSGPAPSPTPTPAPAPTPTPDATPPPPVTSSCSLPPGNPNGTCAYTSPQFADDVEWAIVQVMTTRPQFFDFNGRYGPAYPGVVDADGYTRNVVKFLGQRGYCALYDGEEIALKSSNGFNEQYDILSAAGFVRRGPGTYRATCTPAWF